MSRVLALALIPLMAAAAFGEDLEARFLANQKNLESLQADFRQTITSPGMRQPVVSEGRFYYQAPNQLRIDYSRPAGDYFWLNGDRFEARRRGKPPAVLDASHPSARALVALREVLRGTPPAGEFQKQIERKDGEFLVILTPLAPSPTLPRKIENRVDAKSLALLGMTITMPQGATMEFALENPLRNKPLDPAVFSAAE
jgi:outer membrane lipoprotein-sorting protein